MTFVRHLLVAASIFGLSACSTLTYTPTGRIAYDSVSPEEGMVVVKVMNVKPIGLLNKKWTALKVKHTQTGNIFHVMDTAPTLANYSQFVGQLSPGQYEIANFDAAGASVGAFGVLPALVIFAMTSDSQNLASQPATFTVTKGTVTNLGVIVTSQPDTREEQLKIAILTDEKARAAAFEDVEASTKQKLAALPMQSWDRMPDSPATENAVEIVRQNTRIVPSLQKDKEGRLLLGTPMGMINMRTGEGKWSVISTGTLDWITHATSLEDGSIAAGTDNGKIFVCGTARTGCQQALVSSPDAVVTQIVPMGKWGYAIVQANNKDRMFGETRVFVKNSLTGTEPARQILKAEGLGGQPVLFDGEILRLYEMEPGITRTSKVHQFNPATGAITASSVDFWANHLYRLNDGTLVFNRMNGMSNYNDVSNDNGKTWIRNDVEAPFASRMRDTKVGYGLTRISTGWSTVTMLLSKTTDGGKIWEKVGNPIEVAAIHPIQFSDGRVFVWTGKELLSTADDGKAWTVEWPLKQ